MRHLFLILLLNIPCIAEATMPAPDSVFVSQSSFLEKQGDEKRGFLKKFIEKRLIKRLAKAEGAMPSSSRGKWEAIAGFTLGLFSLAAWVVAIASSFDAGAAAVFGPIGVALGVAGLILSIIALKRAQRWNSYRATRGLAIAGIIINGLLTLGFIIAAFSV